jgi:hypothetical protein
MIERKQCINVWSDMNTWIDFCIIVFETDLEKAEEIIKKAYDEWWELPDIQFEPLADWVCRNLNKNEIKYDIYFKNETEE